MSVAAQVTKKGWSIMDDVTIFRFVAECTRGAVPGAPPRMPWAKLAGRLPGRSDNAVKNRYYSSLRRLARRSAIIMGQHPMPEAVGPTSKRVLSRATQEEVAALKAAKDAFDSGDAAQWTPAVASSLWGADYHIARTLTGSDAPLPADIMAHCNTRGGRAARYLQHRRDKGDAIRKAQTKRGRATMGDGPAPAGGGVRNGAVARGPAPAPRASGAQRALRTADASAGATSRPQRAPPSATRGHPLSDAPRGAAAPGPAPAAPTSAPATAPPTEARRPTPERQQ